MVWDLCGENCKEVEESWGGIVSVFARPGSGIALDICNRFVSVWFKKWSESICGDGLGMTVCAVVERSKPFGFGLICGERFAGLAGLVGFLVCPI